MHRVQGVIYSEGDLFLDDCDFNGSETSVLVYSEPGETAIIRRTELGDQNCKTKGAEPFVGCFLESRRWWLRPVSAKSVTHL